MQSKIFWVTFIVISLAADFILPLWWGLAATIGAGGSIERSPATIPLLPRGKFQNLVSLRWGCLAEC